MAALYTWPTTLPEYPEKGFSESGGVIVLRTPMDSGPSKQRYIGRAPQQINVTYFMSEEQVSVFESFVKDTLKGVSRYNLTHPRLKTQAEGRIVSQSNGQLYTLQYTAPGYYNVSFQLEILP